MLRGEAHRLLRLDENNVEEDLDLPFVTPLSLQQRNGRENDYGRFADDEPSRWSRTQLSRHIGASVVRLFGRVRSLLCTTSTRTAFIIGFLMFTLCFVICTAKLLSTSEPYPRPEARKDEIPQGVPVENSIFKDVLEFERALPQHDPNLPFPEGRKGRYLNFSAHTWGKGWNNVLQEQLLTAHLALLARRAYVFPPHIAREHRPFSAIADLAIPFSAFAYGPITGAPFDGTRGSPNESSPAQDEVTPRAVSEEYFHSVCSEEETVALSVEETAKELGVNMDHDSVLAIVLAWGKKLAEMEQPCVDVRGRPFFWYTDFGEARLLPAWSILESSPLFKSWDWSPLIHSTLEVNGIPPPSNTLSAFVRKSLPPTHPWAWKVAGGEPTGPLEGPSTRASTNRPTGSTPYVLRKLVAVHVRRGDFAAHCKLLAENKIFWNSWNALGTYSRNNATISKGFNSEEFKIDARYVNASYPRLPDSIFDSPYSTAYPHDAGGKVDPAILTREQLWYLHCWPRLDGIRDKLAAVRRVHPELEDVYLMTNGKERWVGGLMELLLEDGWKSVRASRDLVLSDAARAVSQGVDMAIGSWAEVFIGNGVRKYTLNRDIPSTDERVAAGEPIEQFSSMTSNVVGFRLAQGYPEDSIYLF